MKKGRKKAARAKTYGGGPCNPANKVSANKPHVKNNSNLPRDNMPVSDKVYFFSH
jgi:hypothetical protein